MRRTPVLAVLPLLLGAALAGCGSDDGDSLASDPGPTSTGSDSATASASTTPTATPTVGTYPQFAPTDYTYEVTMLCFCPTAGRPISVTVADGKVTEAVYAPGSEQGRTGAAAEATLDDSFSLTINDVIAAANDTEADSVEVDWPAGQEYPTSVRVDKDERAADEEIGYEISQVVVD